MLEAIVGLLNSPATTAATWGAVTTFFSCFLLVISKRWHGKLSLDETTGTQKFHTNPTPRIGGIAIVLGLALALDVASFEVKEILEPLLLASLPAFALGLAEDVTKRISVTVRLLATMASGVLAWLLTDISLTRLDIWGVDWVMKITLVSVLFTAFAVGGVANAINIIDGFNGQASLASGLAFVGYALIAWQVGDTALAQVSMVIAACVWGFFWINWPLGKIFLGDGGAYFVGFALAWLAVLLIERNQGVSAFAALVICAHPVTEVLFSIFRRKVSKSAPGMPDRLHFHSLVMRRYVSRWFGHLPHTLINSITGASIGLMTLPSVVLVNLTYTSTLMSAGLYVAFVLCYVAIYARMVDKTLVIPHQV